MTDLIPISANLDQTIVDIAGQLAPSSKRVYMNDARHFADWMKREAITPDSISRSDMIAYRLHLAESTYAKATKQRMFSVACRLMNEQYIAGRITDKVTQDVKGFKVEGDETTHTALSQPQAKDMVESIDQSTKQGKRDYALILMLMKTGLRRAELVALNRADIRLYSDYGILRNIPRKEKVDADEICRGQPKRTEVLGSHEPDRRRVSAVITCI